MTLLKEYNLIENKKLTFWINAATIPLLVFFFLLFSIGTYLFSGARDFGISISFGEDLLIGYLAAFAVFFLLIILHELIHGLFYKGFNKEGKVRFGFKNGFAYAASPDSFYSKRQFIWICLAPFVLITSALIGLVTFNLLPVIFFIPVASLHAASCVGDFYWVLLLSRRPNTVLVKDTETGMAIYLNDKNTSSDAVKSIE